MFVLWCQLVSVAWSQLVVAAVIVVAAVHHSVYYPSPFIAMSELETKRAALLELIAKNPKSHLEHADHKEVQEEFAALLQDYADTPGVDPLDVVFVIGQTVYGASVVHPHEASGAKCIIDFEYMKQFMRDVFIRYVGLS